MKKLLLVLVLIVGAGSAMAQSKVGHVDSQRIMDTIPSRKEAILKLQQFEQDGITELKEMEADLQKAYTRYQNERPNWSPTIVKIEEEKIMKKEQALQEREQSLNLEMQAYSNELNAPILQRVQESVKIVAERRKLNYVIDASVTLYFDGGTDITNEVILELMKLEGQ